MGPGTGSNSRSRSTSTRSSSYERGSRCMAAEVGSGQRRLEEAGQGRQGPAEVGGGGWSRAVGGGERCVVQRHRELAQTAGERMPHEGGDADERATIGRLGKSGPAVYASQVVGDLRAQACCMVTGGTRQPSGSS